MKSKTGSSITRKLIWASLIAFLATVVTTFTFLFHGIHIKGFSVAGINVENLSLHWNKQLALQIEQLSFNSSEKESSTSSISPTNLFKRINSFRKVFSSIDINKLQIGSFHSRLSYSNTTNIALLDLTEEQFQLAATILFSDETITLTLPQFSHDHHGLAGSGEFTFQLAQNTFTGKCIATVANTVPVTVDFSGDEHQLTFQGTGTDSIKTITPLIELFNLDTDIQPWITDYLVGSRFHLTSFSGTVPWQQPEKILQTLRAKVQVDNCQYTFAQGLEPIKTKYTEVSFENGVLNIHPNHGSFYGQDTQSSWLKIDFNDVENIRLTAFITTTAIANKDIIGLLNYYGIPLPFEQLAGMTETDLILNINLNSSILNIEGNFKLHDSLIGYKNKKYQVKNGVLHLQNSLITLLKSSISYDDLYMVEATGKFDGGQETGQFSILLREFSYPVGQSSLSLQKDRPNPVITYHIWPKEEWLEVSESNWWISGRHIKLSPFKSPITEDRLQLNRLSLSIEDMLQSEISGSITLDPAATNLKCQITHFDFEDLLLLQPLHLHIEGGNEFKINMDASQWAYKDTPVTIEPVTFTLKGDTLTLLPATISLDDIVEAEISGIVKTSSHQTALQLRPLSIDNELIANFIPPDKILHLNFSQSETVTRFSITELALTGDIDSQGNWQLHCNNINTFLAINPRYSSELIQDGQFVLTFGNTEQLDFSGHLQLDKAIFHQNNSPVRKIVISGQHTQKETIISINEDILINLGGSVHIVANSISIDIPLVLKALESFTNSPTPEKQKDKTPKTIFFTGDGIELLLDEQTRVLSDKLHISYDDGMTKAHLDHDSGKLDLTFKNNQFYMEGTNLNKTFMEALSPRIHLAKGTMHLAAQGSLEEYSLLVNAQDLIIKDFAPLNNTLAFLDTIPALITFTWPEYSIKGFPVTSAVAGVTAQNGILDIESFTMKSPVTSMTGKGWVNRNTKKIDLEFNMITQAKTNLNKIPLVGYILVGDEKRPSIHLKVSGDLSDPEVKHSTFKEVLTLPYSILKRTIKLPQFLLKQL